MRKVVDFTKFQKKITKSIPHVSSGFHDPSIWISTNNYALNYLVSGKFNRGIPLGQITLLAGESGAGKSFISANIIRNALEQDVQVVVIDTENALTKEWLMNAGIDIDKYGTPDLAPNGNGQFMRWQMAQIDDIGKFLSEFMDDYIKDYKEVDPDERPALLFVIDSLSQTLTRSDVSQFESGDVTKGDMGRQAKALKALVKNCTVLFADYNIGLLCTNHTYASQDMFDPDDKISGGQGFIFASSIVVAMKKRKLKEDEKGNKITEVRGIRSDIKVTKSRYSKPFESVQVHIPYDSGIDHYSGLVDLFEKKGILVKSGNKLQYIDMKGNEHTYFRKYFATKEGRELLNLMMDEFNAKNKSVEMPDIEDLAEEYDNQED